MNPPPGLRRPCGPALAAVGLGRVLAGCQTPPARSSAANPPARARPVRKVERETTVRFSTDGRGRVVSVAILKSAGPILDRHTRDYVRANWRGPANAVHETTFVYQLR